MGFERIHTDIAFTLLFGVDKQSSLWFLCRNYSPGETADGVAQLLQALCLQHTLPTLQVSYQQAHHEPEPVLLHQL